MLYTFAGIASVWLTTRKQPNDVHAYNLLIRQRYWNTPKCVGTFISFEYNNDKPMKIEISMISHICKKKK